MNIDLEAERERNAMKLRDTQVQRPPFETSFCERSYPRHRESRIWGHSVPVIVTVLNFQHSRLVEVISHRGASLLLTLCCRWPIFKMNEVFCISVSERCH